MADKKEIKEMADKLDKAKALAILRTIIEPMNPGTQKDALQCLAEWVEHNTHESAADMTREQRQEIINGYLLKIRDV